MEHFEYVVQSDAYIVTFYRRHCSKVVVVFTSAGRNGLGEPLEEFKKTLLPFGISMIFVIDRKCQWYSYRETDVVLTQVSKICSEFENIAVLGESMGGCGSLLFSNYADNIDRVLSVSPQFSMQEPFINCDDRFVAYSRQIPFKLVKNFATSRIKDRCIVLFGNFDWREYIHACMFKACGYEVCFIDGADHGVAWWLKSHPSGNLLKSMLCDFLNFGSPFDGRKLEESLGGLITDRSLSATTIDYLAQPPQSFMISAGKSALQSSLGPGSSGTIEEEATRAIQGLYEHQAFSTDLEHSPWWRIDLGSMHVLTQVRLYNKMGWEYVGRARRFVIETSPDDVNWTEVFRKTDDVVFFGYDGRPFIWNCPGSLATRFLRVKLLERTYLHFAQVEIFGREIINGDGRGKMVES